MGQPKVGLTCGGGYIFLSQGTGRLKVFYWLVLRGRGFMSRGEGQCSKWWGLPPGLNWGEREGRGLAG